MAEDRATPEDEHADEPTDDEGPRSAEPEEDEPAEKRADDVGPAKKPEPAAPLAAKPTPNYAFLAIVSILSLAADLGTKWWAKKNLEGAHGGWDAKRVEVIPGYLRLVFAQNKGGAWGILQDEHDALRLPFFLLISVAAIVFIVSLYRKLTPGQHALKWGLPLVLGGALGNLVDRIRYGHVVDFIDAFYKSGGAEHHWPTFNIADVAICVGVGLMAIDMFTSKKKAKPPARKPAPAKDDGVVTP